MRLMLAVVAAGLLGGGGSAAAPEAGRAEQPCPMYTECGLPRATVAREYRHQVEFSPGQTGRPAPYTLYCHASRPLTLPGCLELEEYFDRDRDVRWAPGLSVSPGGLVSGTPTRAGHWRLGLAARDANGDAGLIVGFALDVDLAIRPATLPVARVGKPYKVRFEVLGEEPPFGFAHQGGPCLRTTGLQLDARTGTLSGTPKRAGRCTLKLAVTTTLPRSNVTTQKQYELEIRGEEEKLADLDVQITGPSRSVSRLEEDARGYFYGAEYRVVVTNRGPDAANGVELRWSLWDAKNKPISIGATWRTTGSAGFYPRCADSGVRTTAHLISCDLATMPTRARATLTLLLTWGPRATNRVLLIASAKAKSPRDPKHGNDVREFTTRYPE